MIRLERHGLPDGAPALVAIPGMDGSVGSIAPLVERLGRTRQVVLANYADERNPTLEELAEEIAGAVRSHVQAPLDLWGQSLGTMLAAQLAARPDLGVRKVVLVATWPRLRWSWRRPWAPVTLTNRLMALTPRPAFRAMSRPLMSLACGPVGDGRDHPFFDYVRQSDRDAQVRRTGWEIDRDFSADLARIEQPTLVLMGRNDRFVPDAAEEIAKLEALFADRPARVVALGGAGHVLLPSRAIDAAAGRMEEFLDGV